jgi:hypothetical protein
MAPYRPRAVERRPAHGVALTVAAGEPLASVPDYADIDSFNTAPISSIAPSTLPQRQVVNQ